jgi:hypothetical protein
MSAMVNGINYDWGSIEVVLFGTTLVGVTKINYSKKQEKTNNHGAGYDPVSRGHGKIDSSGTIEVYQDELRAIIAAAPNNDILAIPPFSIIVVMGGSGVNVTKDVLKFCEFTEQAMAAATGDTKLLVTLPIVVGDVVSS